MKKSIFLSTVLVLLLGINANAQKLLIDNMFTLKTAFVNIDSTSAGIYKIALGTINSEREKGYVFFLYHNIFDFNLDLLTPADLSLTIEHYFSGQGGVHDKIDIELTELQPTTEGRGVIISFALPDSLAADLKGELLHSITLIDKSGKGLGGTDKGILRTGDDRRYHRDKYAMLHESIYEVYLGNKQVIERTIYILKARNFFITYANQIDAFKGSFDNMEKYKLYPIPVYSLLLKSADYVKETIGNPLREGINEDSNLTRIYETEDAGYVIIYVDNISINVICYSKPRFRYIHALFGEQRYPFDINVPGEYSVHGAGWESRVEDSAFGQTYTFPDKTQHSIIFYQKGRFLGKVIAKKVK